MNIISYTGSQKGTNSVQFEKLIAYLYFHYRRYGDFIGEHGDCVGGDEEFNSLCIDMGMETRIRPGYPSLNPRDISKRAFCAANVIYPPEPFLERNRKVAKEGDILLGCPFSNEQKGGTWWTIRYALRLRKPTIIFYREGLVSFFNFPSNRPKPDL